MRECPGRESHDREEHHLMHSDDIDIIDMHPMDDAAYHTRF